MSAEIVHLTPEAVTVQNLAHQIAAREDFTAMVAAVRDEDGRWHFLNSAGITAGDLALAAIFLSAQIHARVFED